MSLPRQHSTCSHDGNALKTSCRITRCAHTRKLSYSLRSDPFEHVMPHTPFVGTGIAARFSHRLIPITIITAKGILVVKARVINCSFNLYDSEGVNIHCIIIAERRSSDRGRIAERVPRISFEDARIVRNRRQHDAGDCGCYGCLYAVHKNYLTIIEKPTDLTRSAPAPEKCEPSSLCVES